MAALPPSLLPQLLELERAPPNDPAAFFAAALDGDVAAPGAVAAVEVLRFAARAGLDAEGLMAELRRHGLSEGAASMFADAWAMYRSANVARLATPTPRKLIDLDWSFGVSASSSEHMAMGTTYVQLRLQTATQSGTEFVHMELSLAKFYEFLSELEGAKQSLELV